MKIKKRGGNRSKGEIQQNALPEKPDTKTIKRKETDSPQNKPVFPFTIPTTFPSHPLPLLPFTSGSKL